MLPLLLNLPIVSLEPKPQFAVRQTEPFYRLHWVCDRTPWTWCAHAFPCVHSLQPRTFEVAGIYLVAGLEAALMSARVATERGWTVEARGDEKSERVELTLA